MIIANKLFSFVAWSLIIALSVYFFIENVFVYVTGFRSKNFGESFFNNQVWVVSHLIGGTLALFLGPFQFWKSLRTRYLSFHRVTGKLYIIGAFITGLSALRLSLISSCHPCRISLFILAVLVLVTTTTAYLFIRSKNIKAHRQFMVRSYVTVLSFVAVRIGDVISMNFLFGAIADPTFNRVVNEYFFSFVPLICAEIVMTWWPLIKTIGVRTIRR
jgi:uncharacterized membrane protein